MRSDALRRRENLVRQARRIFAAEGAGVALETVAEAAGVGIATLYRNFSSRGALLDAVATAVLDELLECTEAAEVRLAAGTDGAWKVWSEWATSLAKMELGALSAALAGEYGARVSPGVLELQRELVVVLGRMFELARAERFVGDDVTALELIVGISRLTRPQVATVGAMEPDLGDRMVAVLLVGLRESARA